MTQDEIFMARAIELAQMADSSVYPNPFVGAVITRNNEIIAEGFHQKFGEAHAEVRAVNQVQDKSILNECTIYVTLEPCTHFGKTPPCADLLISHRFHRVVIGSIDPFALVNGFGVERLKKAGLLVEVGVLKEQCDLLNKRFFTFHKNRRPFIVLKWAESKDGFIAPKVQARGERIHITGKISHQLVHLQRSKEHAILVGKNTAEWDNPSLDVRHVAGQNPIRIVIDSALQLSKSLKLFSDGNPTWVLNQFLDGQDGAIRYIKMDSISAETIGNKLYALNILSVYVEGGAQTIQQFLDSDLWDRAYRFVGENYLNNGVPAPNLSKIQNHIVLSKTAHDSDSLLTYEIK